MTLKRCKKSAARVAPADREVMDRAKTIRGQLAQAAWKSGLEECPFAWQNHRPVCHQIEACAFWCLQQITA